MSVNVFTTCITDDRTRPHNDFAHLMDDLNGLDWSASAPSAGRTVPKGTGNYFPSLQPTPLSSGRATPVSNQPSGFSKPVLAAPKSAGIDSFSNLVSFGSTKQSSNLSLAAQQAKLQAEKAKKAEEQRKQYDAHFGNVQSLNHLGSYSQSTATTVHTASSYPFSNPLNNTLLSGIPSSAPIPKPLDSPEEDLFAAFNKDAAVDKSSYYPPPAQPGSGKSSPFPGQARRLDLNDPNAWARPSSVADVQQTEDDDDPFGLGALSQQTKRSTTNPQHAVADEDDFLGDLGKPVEEIRKRQKPIPTQSIDHDVRPTEPGVSSTDPWDKAVNELVEMGFSAEKSRRALAEGGNGLDVQAAVGWLLDDAHRQANAKAQSKSGAERLSERRGQTSAADQISMNQDRQSSVPAWMRQARDNSQPRREDSRSPALSDDLSKTAAAVGTNLLKTANSLWKTSQKKVAQAVSEFQQEPDNSQPKWMRSAGTERQGRVGRPDSSNGELAQARGTATDEAMLLEGDSRPMPKHKKSAPGGIHTESKSSDSTRTSSPAFSVPSTGHSTPVPRWQTASNVPVNTTMVDARQRLTRQAVEEESAKMYISPARRKKVEPILAVAQEPDLLSESTLPPTTTSKPPPSPTTRAPAPTPSAPIVIRPKAPTRNIPALSSIALATVNKHRQAGTDHFKRGDYASAHASYSSALSSLPATHPVAIVVLCNRSLTSLKTGDPKQAVTDADSAIALIGTSRGEDEIIQLDGPKPMKEFWAKAITRKAEALEQTERWADARDVWKMAIEAGAGGATAQQGRQRCEKALAPKAAPKPKPAAVRGPPRGRPAAQSKDSEAVSRMRAANAAAEKADDEKFALADSVDARIKAWRDGRQDNLRALLGGLDQVLWSDSGWKKIGMHELVVNGKVKINYMKAIAKVHPDKLAQDASVEVQMISAAVFATLNEAWDKFKTDNNM